VNKPGTHDAATIAKLFDLSERHVRRLAADGIIPKTAHGQYELVGSIRGYIKYLTDRAVLGAAAGGTDDGEWRLRLLQSKARMASLEADELENLVVRRADVETAWISIITTIRTRLLALPARCANAIVYLRTPAEIAALLATAVSDALEEEVSSNPHYGDDPGDTSADEFVAPTLTPD
jgi:phage terminase Nu1 subunit (DNA packaging protein)